MMINNVLFRDLLGLFLIACSSYIHAENFIYIPKDLNQLLDKNETAINLQYGEFSQKNKLDAIILTIKNDDALHLKSDFKNLYAFPRKIYIFQQNNNKWKLLAKNDRILKALAPRKDYDSALDQINFMRQTEPNSPSELLIIREGQNPQRGHAVASFNLNYNHQDRNIYVMEESYSYYNIDNEDFPCNANQKYSSGSKLFNLFQDHEDEIISNRLRHHLCLEQEDEVTEK